MTPRFFSLVVAVAVLLAAFGCRSSGTTRRTVETYASYRPITEDAEIAIKVTLSDN